ncbi:MAG: hypothetical protein JO149_07565 [Gammaproteobacteria bacterium]|nr:hypothetical protein [Gammaproteobacteria bacterium]
MGTTLDAQFLKNLNYPNDKYYIFQEDYFAVELSKSERSWNHPLGNPSINKIIKFSLLHTDSIHRYFFKHRIIISAANSLLNPDLETLITETISHIPCVNNHFRHKITWSKPFIIVRRLKHKLFQAPFKLLAIFKKVLKKILLKVLSWQDSLKRSSAIIKNK